MLLRFSLDKKRYKGPLLTIISVIIFKNFTFKITFKSKFY